MALRDIVLISIESLYHHSYMKHYQVQDLSLTPPGVKGHVGRYRGLMIYVAFIRRYVFFFNSCYGSRIMIRFCKIYSEDRYILPNLLSIVDFPLLNNLFTTNSNQSDTSSSLIFFPQQIHSTCNFNIETNVYMYFHWFSVIEIIEFLCTTSFSLQMNQI